MTEKPFCELGFGPKAVDLTGQTFGRLTATCPSGVNMQRNIVWECLCSCGEVIQCSGVLLRTGGVKSCGCLRVDMARVKNKKEANEVIIVGDVAEMTVMSPGGKGFVKVLIDADRLALVSASRWSLSDTGYVKAYAGKGITPIRMHRLLMGAKEGMIVDHINGDPLDNRMCNLRICTQAENSRNMKSSRGISRFKGVRYRTRGRKHWYAEIKFNYKNRFLGLYASEVEAARAYNKKAKELFGEFALLNNIDPV